MTDETEVAECCNCGRKLKGLPYYMGKGYATHPVTGKDCKVNYYGGFVCSRSCDYRASLSLEQSMPGHKGQTVLRGDVARSVEANWRTE